jgi:hypothetical protein
MRRVRSTDSGTGAAITRASSTGSSKNKDNIPIDDFIDQENLAGKYVIVTLAKEVENAQVKRAASIMRQHSLKRQPSLTRQPSSGFARAPSSSGFVRAPSFERADSASGISFTNVVDIISCLNGLGMMPACWRNSGVYLYTHWRVRTLCQTARNCLQCCNPRSLAWFVLMPQSPHPLLKAPQIISGAEAIIIAMEQVERHVEIKGELPEVNCPVVCISHETVAELGDGQVSRKTMLPLDFHPRGARCIRLTKALLGRRSRSSASCTEEIW